MPNRTVPTIRAQPWPRLQAAASQSHRPMQISDPMMVAMTPPAAVALRFAWFANG